MLTIRASSPLGIYPCPARGTLLPCVTDGIFNAVHYPWLSVVIAAFLEAFREAHEAFSLFQDSKGFSVLQNIFLFRRQFHFLPPFCFSSHGHSSTSSEVAISTSPRQFSRYSFPLLVSLPMTVKISSSKSSLRLSP